MRQGHRLDFSADQGDGISLRGPEARKKQGRQMKENPSRQRIRGVCLSGPARESGGQPAAVPFLFSHAHHLADFLLF
jgi:hypothetical protein